MKNFTDEKILLREIKEGNEEAFEFLFRSYYPRLRGYAVRFVEEEETVRDLIQESFFEILGKAASDRGGIDLFASFCNGAEHLPQFSET